MTSRVSTLVADRDEASEECKGVGELCSVVDSEVFIPTLRGRGARDDKDIDGLSTSRVSTHDHN